MRAGTTIPESVYLMFQMTFAVITPALIIGAYVERIKFSAVLLISGLWLLLVYVPVAHWVWGGGWLAARGTLDYAGGIVVHVTAGVSALVIAVMLGARHEFPHGIPQFGHAQPGAAPFLGQRAETHGNAGLGTRALPDLCDGRFNRGGGCIHALL